MEGGRRAVFLDRDDTLCKDVPYCRKPEDLNLLPGAGDAVRRLNEAGYCVVVVTNQSGIARGFLTEGDLTLIHDKMKRDLASSGAHVDGIYHCPHHPDDGCECRKPKPTMVLRAAKDLRIDLKRSYTVGDRLHDVQMGRAAGTLTVLVRPPDPKEEFKEASRLADGVSRDLASAVEWILLRERK